MQKCFIFWKWKTKWNKVPNDWIDSVCGRIEKYTTHVKGTDLCRLENMTIKSASNWNRVGILQSILCNDPFCCGVFWKVKMFNFKKKFKWKWNIICVHKVLPLLEVPSQLSVAQSKVAYRPYMTTYNLGPVYYFSLKLGNT